MPTVLTMIDIKCEQLLSIADACKSLPQRRGRPISFSTVWRWMRRGVRGVRLESMPVGGVLFTSSEALARFFAALERRRQPVVLEPPPRACRAQQRMAKRILEKAGI